MDKINRKNLITGVATLFVFLILLKLTTAFWFSDGDNFLSAGSVQGVTLKSHGKIYPLNLEQQNRIISILRKATAADDDLLSTQPTPPSIDKLIVHSLDIPDVDVIPLGYVDGNMVFQMERWQPEGFMVENSDGELKEILQKAIGH